MSKTEKPDRDKLPEPQLPKCPKCKKIPFDCKCETWEPLKK